MASVPSLDELRERLAGFEEAHDLCAYIDHWPSVLKCRAENQRVVDLLKHEIALREVEENK